MKKEQEEEDADVEIWKYAFGFSKMAVLKCAIELGIAEAIEKNGSPVTLTELSSTLKCDPLLLQRVMRFLTHLRIFKEEPTTSQGSIAFQQTPLSRRLMGHGEEGNGGMAAIILLESSPVMLAPWHGLSSRVLANGVSTFDVWGHSEADAAHCKLISDAMACGSKMALPEMIEECPDVFDGIESLVDVGGSDGTTLRMLMKAFPWIIRGINFDLPHVIGVVAEEYCHGIKHVEGDMFDNVPKADAVIIKWVLHDWGDDECIKILKNCREAIPKDKGKVIIVEAIMDEEDNNNDNKFKSVVLMLDMVMMAHTNTGKERTLKEWDFVINQAGFSSYKIKHFHAVQSIIEAFP